MAKKEIVKKASTKKAISVKSKELKPEELRWTCPENKFKFKTTETVKPLEKIVGQPRAIEAIRLGAKLKSKGYNIFVSGLAGTGRLSTVKRILEEVTTSKPELFDFCYVYNFTSPDEPRLIKLPKGVGKEFAKSIDDTISYLRKRLAKIFEDDTYQNSRRRIIEDYQRKERLILDQFDQKIKPHGFVRGQLENEQGISQPEVFPLVHSKPVQIETIEGLVEKGDITRKKADELKSKYHTFHNEIYELARHGMKLMQEFRKAMFENDKAAASIIIDSVIKAIAEKYTNAKVNLYLDEVRKHIIENVSTFFGAGNTLVEPVEDGAVKPDEEEKFGIFKVNVILDNTNTERVPIIVRQIHPTQIYSEQLTDHLTAVDSGGLILLRLNLGLYCALTRVILLLMLWIYSPNREYGPF